MISKMLNDCYLLHSIRKNTKFFKSSDYFVRSFKMFGSSWKVISQLCHIAICYLSQNLLVTMNLSSEDIPHSWLPIIFRLFLRRKPAKRPKTAHLRFHLHKSIQSSLRGWLFLKSVFYCRRCFVRLLFNDHSIVKVLRNVLFTGPILRKGVVLLPYSWNWIGSVWVTVKGNVACVKFWSRTKRETGSR